ncbi:hypothetical protein HDV05_007536 [Chytridiales sp. JEL 0842]|nr:hypothetical protein HDV05_007536 [Chytridiales sp. JEL 0842]
MGKKKDKTLSSPIPASTSGPSEEKYRALKAKLREVLEDNDRLSKKLHKAKNKVSALQRDNGKLLKKLQKYQDSSSSSDSDSSSSSDSSSDSDSAPAAADANPPPPTITGKRRRNAPNAIRRIQRIPTDENGVVTLPIQVGVLVIYSLGEIVHDRPGFHTDRYIFPVGYKSSRQFLSIVDPNNTTTYTSEIVDSEDGPKFIVTPQDAPEKAATGSSATGAWTIIIKAANLIRGKEHTSSASGPDFFGISQGVVQKLIQDLPNARKCLHYVWQEFEFIQGRGSKKLLRPGEENPRKKKKLTAESPSANNDGVGGGSIADGDSIVAGGGGGIDMEGTSSVGGSSLPASPIMPATPSGGASLYAAVNNSVSLTANSSTSTLASSRSSMEDMIPTSNDNNLFGNDATSGHYHALEQHQQQHHHQQDGYDSVEEVLGDLDDEKSES